MTFYSIRVVGRPGLDGTIAKDPDELLAGWIGGPKPVAILALSGVPSSVPERFVVTMEKRPLLLSRQRAPARACSPALRRRLKS